MNRTPTTNAHSSTPPSLPNSGNTQATFPGNPLRTVATETSEARTSASGYQTYEDFQRALTRLTTGPISRTAVVRESEPVSAEVSEALSPELAMQLGLRNITAIFEGQPTRWDLKGSMFRQ